MRNVARTLPVTQQQQLMSDTCSPCIAVCRKQQRNNVNSNSFGLGKSFESGSLITPRSLESIPKSRVVRNLIVLSCEFWERITRFSTSYSHTTIGIARLHLLSFSENVPVSIKVTHWKYLQWGGGSSQFSGVGGGFCRTLQKRNWGRGS